MNFISQISNFKFLSIPFRVLSSKTFLLWLIGGWIIYYVSSAIWMRESFAHFVIGIQTRRLIQIPCIFFLVSGYLNLIRASADVYRKGRIQFFVWLVLPFGALIFMTGFFMSIKTRQFDWITVAEGHSIKPQWSADDYIVKKIESGLKDTFLDIDVLSGKGIFNYEPKLVIADKSSSTFEVGAFPPKKIGNTYFHILNFGLAPGIRLLEKEETKEEGYMPLKILLPGSSDYADIKPYPYRLLVSIEPERVIQKGNLKASEFNLKNPLYKIRVFKGEKVIAEGDSRKDISFDNLALSYIGSTFWVQLEVVKDPALPLILAGIFLTVLGIPLYLLRFFLKLSGKI